MLDMTRGVCALCQHNRIIQAWPLEHGHGQSTYNFAATEARVGLLGRTQQYGHMVAYICQSCGFVMWFANDPGSIPIGEQYSTKLIEGPPQGGE